MTTLFLQSEMADPYRVYKEMRDRGPLHWSEQYKIWAVYSYGLCKEILNHQDVAIPSIAGVRDDDENAIISQVRSKLVRLNNPPGHTALKEHAFYLFEKIKAVDVDEMLDGMIALFQKNHTLDWVEVGKQLFVKIILKAFDFSSADEAFIIDKMPAVIKIMGAIQEEQAYREISKTTLEVYEIVADHFITTGFANQASREFDLLVSNFIGMLIQCYDAGRGLLCNALLYAFKFSGNELHDRNCIRKVVAETMRFDSPVHHTRRVATGDIRIGEQRIRKGDMILVVLAAANRDPQYFTNPETFDVERKNNMDNLSFGEGGHMCLAKYFSIDVVTQALGFLFQKYPYTKLLQKKIQYEPLMNVRLAVQLQIALKLNQ